MECGEPQLQRRAALGTWRQRAKSGQRRTRIGREGGGKFLSGLLRLLAGTGDGRQRGGRPQSMQEEPDRSR
jgi:hypothetical protein